MHYALVGTSTPRLTAESASFERERKTSGGQGTVEYVGLILLVSLLMVGMVAAMRGFNNCAFRGVTPPLTRESSAPSPAARGTPQVPV
jgi:hypothetical protein